VLFVFEPAVTMTCFPVVDEDLRVLCFIAERTGQSTMIFVCVSEYDATEI
jgi:hypothetical protein